MAAGSLRMVVSCGLALCMAIAFFWLMHWPIRGARDIVEQHEPLMAIDFVRLARNEEPATRERKPPPPPPPPPKRPPPPEKLTVDTAAPQQAAASPVPFAITNLGLSAKASGGPFIGQLGTPGGGGPGPVGVGGGLFEGDIVPLQRIAPRYPRQALRDGITGWVELEFVVNPDGTVRDVRVVNAKPRRVFDAAAIAAARRWRFKPKVVNGQAVAQRGLQRIEFKLSD